MISLLGERYEAKEKFIASLPKDVLDYYSNTQLAKAGWVSYDAFEKPDGIHYVFFHKSGVYLSVEFLKCPDSLLSTCISIWKSEQSKNVIDSSPDIFEQIQSATTGSFGKKSPVNGATNQDPKSIVLSWNAYTPEPDNYSYCVKEGSACSADDPEWTNTWGKTSVTLTNLAYDKTYYWQVKARVCASCVPQKLVYADSGTVWTFKTHPVTHGIIVGNVGVPGAVLSYVDITSKTVTADNYGSYLITVPLGWSGAITPAKPGYLFSPESASFTNLTALQTIQNFNIIPAHLISGNVSIPGVTLSYTYGTPRNVISANNGSYTITVPSSWSGTITPAKPGYIFLPSSRTYVNVVSDQPSQNYTATAIYTITGNVGASGVTLSYTDGTAKTVTSQGDGSYTITVPSGWSGTVTPSKADYIFSPLNRSYSNVTTNQIAQDYTATLVYTISGNVGVGGVTLSYTDGGAKTVTSKGDGSYTITVPGGWSGTVTPTSTCHTFAPLNLSYSNLGANTSGQNYTSTFNTSIGCSNINVTIGGNTQGNYGIGTGQRLTDRYGINGGPVRVRSTNGVNMFTSQRAIYGSSFNSIVGFPADQLTTEYWFTSLDDTGMITYLVIGNPSETETALVDVYIGGVKKNTTPYSIPPGQRVYPRYGINGGPVRVVSTNGVSVFTSERTKYGNSFNEVMGFPSTQLDTEFWFTSYDDAGMITYLVIGNPSETETAEVDVYIGGVKKNTTPYSILPGQRVFPRYGINGGPVRVVSTNGVKVFTSERTKYGNSFNEVLGYPIAQTSTELWFTSLDDASMITYLVIGNPSETETAEVDVYIGGVKKNTTPYSILPGRECSRGMGSTEDQCEW
ncbi:MAG: hypothetical protein IPP66_21730 [Anaerolineales bacterium]|nr:hypothetical protein [Anaerolineales bacterium]